MKVDSVKQNYQNGYSAHNKGHNPQIYEYGSVAQSSPAFTGATSRAFESMAKIEERFRNLFPKRENKLLKIFDWFERFRGEKGGIVTTAVGTGFVAPFPIAFNPLVKAKPGATEEEKEELKKTKRYSAWRQPVSAFVAIMLQVPILRVIDRVLDTWHNNPKYSKNLWILSDRSNLNTDSYKKDQYKDCYLGRQLSKELKNKSLDDILVAESMEKIDGEKKADTIKRIIKHRSDKQIEDVATEIRRDGQMMINQRAVPNEALAGVVNGQIDDYAKEIRKLKIDDEIKIDPKTGKNLESGIEFYTNRSRQLVRNENVLKEILSFDKLPKLDSNPEKVDPVKLNAYLQEYIDGKKLTSEGKKINKDVEQLLKEITNKQEGVRSSRCSRTLERIDTIKEACHDNYSMETYREYMVNQNKELETLADSFEKLKIPQGDIDSKAVTSDVIKSTIKNIEEKCIINSNDKKVADLLDSSSIFETDAKTLGNKVAKDITKAFKKFVDTNYKGTNQITKILVGCFITLPITCCTLNWIYPRFMEIFFPNLAGIKKGDNVQQAQNGGNK